MFLEKNKKQKILAIILAFLLWVNPLLVPVAWAEGEESQPESAEIVSPEVSPTPEAESTLPSEPSPSPSSSNTEIQTGEANALSEIENEINTNQETLPGEITVSSGDCSLPEGEASCPGKTEVANDNSATISNNATSSATSGGNLIQNSSGSADIQTGDAIAVGLVNNQVNTNIVELEPPAMASEDVAEEGENASNLRVENKNEGEVKNAVNVEASSGENSANQNTGSATILTGDALALANILNFLNTNIVGSNFELFWRDILGDARGNIDLNQIWKEIMAKNGGEGLFLAGEENSSNLQLLVKNLNQAYLENNVNVGAKTGGNQANENGQASIETGEAMAIANVNNFVNTNILGAKFFLGTINIFGDFEGNLILPRPENFSSSTGEKKEETSLVFCNQNQAEVENNLEVEANSGKNEGNNNEGGTIETGNAWAIANVFSLVNLNLWRNNWFFLLINNLGNWTGKIFGWSKPEAVEEPEGGNQVFQLSGSSKETIDSGENLNFEEEENLPLASFQNQNQATVKNNIRVITSTGENQASNNQGEVEIKTGNALSLANLLNFVNLNILGGCWFFGLVNILGSWRGDAIFAYPDVAVSLTNGKGQVMVGEITEFILVYKNQGYENAKDVVLKLQLPEGVAYLEDNSGYQVTISGRTYSWNIGFLAAGERGEFKIKVEILPDFPFEEELTFWSKMIPQVRAAENQKEKEIQVTAFIVTSDLESDSSNNSSLAKTLVYLPFSSFEESSLSEETSGNVDQRQPVLEISAWNNVGEFVYPGDTVTFEIKIRNKGEVPAYDVYLVQTLHNGVPKDFGISRFSIGKIDPGKGAKLTFGIKLNGEIIIPEGHFYTLAQAFGKAQNGNEVASNKARTDFDVKYKEVATLFMARADEKREILEEVLGAEKSKCPPKEEKILPYVLLFILSSLWIVEKGRKVSGIFKGNEI